MTLKNANQTGGQKEKMNIEPLKIEPIVRDSQDRNIEAIGDMAGKRQESNEKLDQTKVWEMLEGLMRNLKEVDAFLKTNKSEPARDIIMESLESYQKAVDHNLKNEPAQAYEHIKKVSALLWHALTLLGGSKFQKASQL